MRNAILLCIAVMAVDLVSYKSTAEIPGKERTFFIEESISLKPIPPKIGDLKIWIPIPSNNEWQTVSDFKLTAPFATTFITEKRYGNKIIYIESKHAFSEKRPYIEVIVSYKALRKERGISDAASDHEKDISRYLKPDNSVPIDGVIKELAEEITRGKPDDLEKARAVYHYLIKNLTYAKDDPNVCGIGNSLITLKHKKGMCTDWHSLFISLVRSLGIPAKFEIGFPIPENKDEGAINGYHCWALFYIKDKGWIPVDASEAYKHPEKRDYFFGHIDEDRIGVATGRDIRLENSRSAEALNFFVYPYIEVDGLKFNDMNFKISFKEMK